MFKIYPQMNNVFQAKNSSNKCGEIYCENPEEFTIVCSFCEMKIFEFRNFLLHFKNIHFDNDLIKSSEDNRIPSKNQSNINVQPAKETQRQEQCNRDAGDFATDAGRHHPQTDATEKENNSFNSYEKGEPSSENAVSEDDFIPSVSSDESTNTPPPRRAALYTKKTKKASVKCGIRLSNRAKSAPKATSTTSEAVNCSLCAVEFPNARRLESHTFKEHGVKCTKCQKEFKAKYRLIRHMDTHVPTEERNFLCDFENCTKRFLTKRNLYYHRKTHTEPKNLICEICGYTCRIKETLRTHVRTHTGEKPYACKICEKRFVSSSMLSEHRASHLTERPHVCNVCGASFTRPKALYHHKHLHLDIKKFKCKLCSNSYAQASGLAAHVRKHKNNLI